MPKMPSRQTPIATKPTAIAPPADLLAALRSVPAAAAAFDALPLSHRRDYIKWIGEAKQDATRARRIAKTVERLVAAAK